MKEFASNGKNEQRESTLNCSLQKCLQKCLVFKALRKESQGVSKSSGHLHFFFLFCILYLVFCKKKGYRTSLISYFLRHFSRNLPLV